MPKPCKQGCKICERRATRTLNRISARSSESLFEAFQHSRGGGDAHFAGCAVDSCRAAWDPFEKDAPASQPDDLHCEMEEEARGEETWICNSKRSWSAGSVHLATVPPRGLRK